MNQQCLRCQEFKEIENFSNFIATLKSRKETRRRKICRECRYRNIKYKMFTWVNASKEEKLMRLKRNLDHFVIKQKGCWDWNGFIRPDGYTRIKFMNRARSIGGHVASWMVYNNVIDIEGINVLHKCDNRKCTNPKHLFSGSYSDNMIDMVQKGRCKIAKLTVRKVKNIKNLIKDGIHLSKIARKYKVHWATINDIKRGITWKHVLLD